MIGLKNADGEHRAYILAVRTDIQATSTIYVDHFGRKYRGWERFMRNNRLPTGYLVYPQDGKYRVGKGGDYVLDAAWLMKYGHNFAKCMDYIM